MFNNTKTFFLRFIGVNWIFINTKIKKIDFSKRLKNLFFLNCWRKNCQKILSFIKPSLIARTLLLASLVTRTYSSLRTLQFLLSQKLGRTCSLRRTLLFASQTIKKRKKLILIGFILLVLFLFFYAITETLAKFFIPILAELKVWKAEIGMIMFTIIMIPVLAMVFFGISNYLLNWTLQPQFIGGLDFTLANPIIEAGWTTVSSLINIFFILILVIIAVRVALRHKEYEIMKLLPKFIVAVLLVNFGPVIFALIANISDVVMNHFLSGAVDGIGSFYFFAQINFIYLMYGLIAALVVIGVAFFIPGGWVFLIVGIVAAGAIGVVAFWEIISMFLFLIFGGIIQFLFAALLFARQFAIWILIIISPVAFLLWILPGEPSKYARMWWDQFIGWCFVGISAAFFLYLAHLLIVEPLPNVPAWIRMWAVFFFLVISFIIVIKTGPMGATAVTGAALDFSKGANKYLQLGSKIGAVKLGEKMGTGNKARVLYGRTTNRARNVRDRINRRLFGPP